MAAFDQVGAQARQLDRQWELTAGACALRGRVGPAPVPGRGPGEPPGRAHPGAGLEREAGRGRTTGAGRGTPPSAVDPLGRSGGASADPGVGAGPPERSGSADDDSDLDRKQLLGFLIKDVTPLAGETTIQVAIRWQTEACTVLRSLGPSVLYEVRRTDPVGRRSVPGLGDRHLPIGRSPALRIRRVPLGYRASVHAATS